MKPKINLFAGILLVAALFLGACQVESSPDDPVNSNTPVTPTEIVDFSSYQQDSYVDTIKINLMESFPLQVSVVVQGNLPDGCTEVVGSTVDRTDDSTFSIKIYTERDPLALCTQALVPFEEVVKLDVAGLSAGTYTVKVYDVSETFTFEQDN